VADIGSLHKKFRDAVLLSFFATGEFVKNMFLVVKKKMATNRASPGEMFSYLEIRIT